MIFERDIPEFKGKTWRQRGALYRQARNLDKRIWVRSILANLIYAPLFPFLLELRLKQILPSLWWVIFLYLAIGFPLTFFLRALLVNPLIKNVLEKSKA